jgi:hypothetical protein
MAFSSRDDHCIRFHFLHKIFNTTRLGRRNLFAIQYEQAYWNYYTLGFSKGEAKIK